MSVQFGTWNFNGSRPTREYIEKVNAVLAPYGPDGDGFYSRNEIAILYRAFHTTKESRTETQPHISPSGSVITWDGRLDNRAELLDELNNGLSINSTDVEIVSSAYENWGANCFARLIGDWALSVWNPMNRSIILAKDPIGTRHLYYVLNGKRIAWCTVLDPLVLSAEKPFNICEEYVAGWFSTFPAAHLTPYAGVQAVPPSAYVLLKPGKHLVTKYWDFDPDSKIRYRTNAEYEEHFRHVFAQAVQRRLRSDTAVLAELSGGRDSSSIVYMADSLIEKGAAETPRLDTISYYDDSEPNWNERPYFAKVEEQRGRIGFHIDVGFLNQSESIPAELDAFPRFGLIPTPAKNVRTVAAVRTCLKSQGNRIILSGTGGDEVMGGVPTPTPELQDLMATASLKKLTLQLKSWALQKRKPWFHLLLQAAVGFVRPTLNISKHHHCPEWLKPEFANRYRMALAGYPQRVHLLGALPTFQDNINTLQALRRQLAAKPLLLQAVCDKAYPYLDRDLLEFMYAIPREHSVCPKLRRALMRRALTGIVPDEILNRKRKASVARAPLLRISTEYSRLAPMSHQLVSDSLGIVNSKNFLDAIQIACRGEDWHWHPLLRAVYMEDWLRQVLNLGIIVADKGMRRSQRWELLLT
jgi:asparagine synthase (glutamine-hydrolysing)